MFAQVEEVRWRAEGGGRQAPEEKEECVVCVCACAHGMRRRCEENYR